MENNSINESKKIKFSFSRLWGNNRVLMVLSILIAFGIWIWVSIDKSPEVTKTITNVPVQINLSNSIPEQLNLRIFGETNFTVDVTVTGKKYILSSLDNDDITIEANVNYVDSPGIKTLQLKAVPKSDILNFNISSLSRTYIEVFFDTYKEIELAIDGNISSPLKSIVPDDCIAGDLVMSKGSVILSGPATEMNRVTNVKATAKVDTVLTKTTTFDPEFEIITSDGSKLEYSTINLGDTSITMTVPVLKIVTLPTAIEFKNAPSYFVSNPLSYTVSPATVSVAIPVESIETTKSVIVDTIDFSDIINSYNTFNIDASSITSFKLIDNSVKRFRVRIDASDYSMKTITVPSSSVTLKNSRDDFQITLDNSKDITLNIAGSASSLETLSADKIKIEIDTADKSISADTKTINGFVSVSDVNDCWAVGKYDIKVFIKPVE